MTDRHYSVLVAEDNKVNQIAAEDMLNILGCAVDMVDNGPEAIDHLSQNSYDVVFMDCQMPVMDGFEATQTLKAGSTDTPPIVAMAAHAMAGDEERCLAAGMDDYVTKPLEIEDFARMLTKWAE
jgi:CheY-like chemotaxis protein